MLNVNINIFLLSSIISNISSKASTTTQRPTIAPLNYQFICDFDEYREQNTNICNGITVFASGQATISGLELDSLTGTSKIITDYTSISK